MDVDQPEQCVERVLERVGKRVVLAAPLGLGKPIPLLNALYERAKLERDIHLTIFTALTLEVPRPRSDLEKRFLGPLIERWYSGFPKLEYLSDLRRGNLPPNVTVNEFFMSPAAFMSVPYAQQHYVSTNYTHVDDALADRDVNVVAQLVALDESFPDPRYSLACNPDLTLDVFPKMRERLTRSKTALVGQVSRRLPFLEGDAVLDREQFDILLDDDSYDYDPFPVPSRPVSLAEHAIGLRAASLVRDDGTIQIGIGSLADALCHALILRHRENEAYRGLLAGLGEESAHADTFHMGLYGSSEMLVPGFLDLIEAGVVRRRVRRSMDTTDVDTLLHAAFYLGPQDFYERLRRLPDAERSAINMTAVSYINELYGDEALKREQRRHGSFVNNAMMVTLLGAAVSDGLKDGRVVSGVGGQYNFVAQSHALEDGESIIALNATRTHKGKTSSNIVWEYPHITIPRHLRDVVVTEYGVARLKARSDRDVIAALLNVCDSRFQERLLTKAKAAKKIEGDYAIPDRYRQNTPERLKAGLHTTGFSDRLPHFPLGTDMTDEEATLAVGLAWLKERNTPLLLTRLLMAGGATAKLSAPMLDRLGLGESVGVQGWATQRLIAASLDGAAVVERPLR